MTPETVEAALALIEDREDFAWVTVIESIGSSPRHAGAHMLVRADGSITGTIGGGALEAEVIRNALTVPSAKSSVVVEFDLTGRQPSDLGMICGGRGLVLIDHVDTANPAARDLFRRLLDLMSSGRRGWLVTVIPEEGGKGLPAGRCLVDSEGSVTGDPICPIETLQELAKKGGTHDGIIAAGESRAYVESVGPQETVFIFGAGHCGQRLAPMVGLVGFSTVIVDDRAEFANRERFPTADRILVPDSFGKAMDGVSVDEDGYIVIMTRGHLNDKAVLAQALKTRAGYIGMIGSDKKVKETFRALAQEGFSPEALARVHAPIGLDVGSETPQEIAVSIAAQLIQVRASRRK